MNTKYCGSCKKTKSISLFSKNPTKKDGLQTKCKECQKRYSRAHYKENKQLYLNHNKKAKQTKKEFVDSGKTKCCKCGESELCCLDYHHLDESTKLFELSKYHLHTLVKIKAEIAKCIVVCANCHRKIHNGIVT